MDDVDDIVDGEPERRRQRHLHDRVGGARSDHVGVDDLDCHVVLDDLDESVRVLDCLHPRDASIRMVRHEHAPCSSTYSRSVIPTEATFGLENTTAWTTV